MISVLRDALLLLRELAYGIVRNNSSLIAGRLRRWVMGTPCRIDTAVVISHPRNFHGAPRSALRHGCHIINRYGSVTLGTRSHLGAFCHVNAMRGEVRLGDDVAIGPGTAIISYSNQYEAGADIADSTVTDDVAIADHVFVGANVTILPGAVIEPHVVVGAGAVVKGRLESYGVYVGAPCRRVRELPRADKPGGGPEDEKSDA
ncbi:MAG: hypothetical protein AAFN78_00065 [Pseudomonadota bacterium]